jgi:hypothetical protein
MSFLKIQSIFYILTFLAGLSDKSLWLLLYFQISVSGYNVGGLTAGATTHNLTAPRSHWTGEWSLSAQPALRRVQRIHCYLYCVQS